jgi:hypothetical protein
MILLTLAAHLSHIDRIEHRLLRLGFMPYDAHQLARAPRAERKRALEVMILCGPNGANDDDGENVSCDGPLPGHLARSMPEYRACGWAGKADDTSPAAFRCARPGWDGHRYRSIRVRYRSAVTGKWVTPAFAKAHPDTTVKVTTRKVRP